ncbi:MAG: hypothetical protein ACR2MI_01200 [Flavobacteriaceae bacterium]
MSESEYQNVCQKVFSKLQVGNGFAAVQKAFQSGLLNQKEYTIEKIKGLALKFATTNLENIKVISGTDSKKNSQVNFMSLDWFTIIKSMKQSLLISLGLIILESEKQDGLHITQLKYI